ncbi:hypothetical protein BCT30_13585 [Enterovibrio norvegicus]|nr:hypothetical protein BCT30_13585 [Enterovibrio norvegicus]
MIINEIWRYFHLFQQVVMVYARCFATLWATHRLWKSAKAVRRVGVVLRAKQKLDIFELGIASETVCFG